MSPHVHVPLLVKVYQRLANFINKTNIIFFPTYCNKTNIIFFPTYCKCTNNNLNIRWWDQIMYKHGGFTKNQLPLWPKLD